LLQTGETHVFAIGRCFSSAYRDGFSSAEKLALVERQLNTTLEQQYSFAGTIVRTILNDDDTAGAETMWSADDWPTVPLVDAARKTAGSPEIQTMGAQADDKDKREVFRILVPPGIVVAEGDTTALSPTVRIGGAIVHLERLVRLLSPTRLSQIRDLGATATESKR